MRSRLFQWGKAPIIVPRWMLTMKYLLFSLLGAIGLFVGIPTLNLTTWEGYTAIWSFFLLVFASIAAWASVQHEREGVEKWMALGVTALLSSYLLGNLLIILERGEWLERSAFAVVLLTITLLPAVRTASLLFPPTTKNHPDE